MDEVISIEREPDIEFHLEKEREHVEEFYNFSQKAKSKQTLATYKYGWMSFTKWCQNNGYSLDNDDKIPLMVGMFLSDLAKSGKYKVASIFTYFAGIKHFLWENHRLKINHPELKHALKGIKNDLRGIPTTKKKAIKAEDLREILKPLHQSDKLIDIRDKSLLLIGFCGAFRRSELAGICMEHIDFDLDGITIIIPYSKTDQEGKGQSVSVPRGKYKETCPILALHKWLDRSHIKEGALFRGVNRHGHLNHKQLSTQAIADIVKKRGALLFDSKELAGHSLRRGLITSAIEAKTSESVIMKHTRHKSVNMLMEYFESIKDYRNGVMNNINI